VLENAAGCAVLDKGKPRVTAGRKATELREKPAGPPKGRRDAMKKISTPGKKLTLNKTTLKKLVVRTGVRAGGTVLPTGTPGACSRGGGC
jgi:hypothetical protein